VDGKKCVDPGLQTLLDMDGEIFLFEQSGHWVKIEAHPIEPNDQIPHGIKYSLTLHDRNNQRVLGFDNAHGVRPKRKKFGAQKVTWDHKHVQRSVEGYEFESAGQLMEDFWKAIDEIVK
jgi:hypothetical protein